MPKSSSTKEDSYSTSEMHGASIGRPHRRKMNSFAFTVLPNTANGIWESTTKNQWTPRDTTNFLMEISKMSTAAAYSLLKAARANTSTTTSRTRPRTCTGCWTSARLHRNRSAHELLPSERRAVHDDPIAVSAVHDPKHQAEQSANQQTRHHREIERYIFPLDHDVAGQPAQPEPTQIGPKQASH